MLNSCFNVGGNVLEVLAHVDQPTNWLQLSISVSSIITSVIAIVISITTYKSQVRHNKNSVKPILNIICGDYENDIYVRIDNYGVGPAIIKRVLCSNGKDNDSCLYHLIPEKARVKTQYSDSTVKLTALTHFVEDITDRTIALQKSIVLLQQVDPDSKIRVALRTVLEKITIQVEYTDIYGKEKFVVKRSLAIFGRTLSKAQALVTL